MLLSAVDVPVLVTSFKNPFATITAEVRLTGAMELPRAFDEKLPVTLLKLVYGEEAANVMLLLAEMLLPACASIVVPSVTAPPAEYVRSRSISGKSAPNTGVDEPRVALEEPTVRMYAVVDELSTKNGYKFVCIAPAEGFQHKRP